jgi:hypothetical protein
MGRFTSVLEILLESSNRGNLYSKKVIGTYYLENQDVDGIIMLILDHKETGCDCMELVRLIKDMKPVTG